LERGSVDRPRNQSRQLRGVAGNVD
jgi:hypothetical protein